MRNPSTSWIDAGQLPSFYYSIRAGTDSRIHEYGRVYEDSEVILQNHSWIPPQIRGFWLRFTDSGTDSWILAQFMDSWITDSGTDSRIAQIHGFTYQNTVECTKIYRIANPSIQSKCFWIRTSASMKDFSDIFLNRNCRREATRYSMSSVSRSSKQTNNMTALST